MSGTHCCSVCVCVVGEDGGGLRSCQTGGVFKAECVLLTLPSILLLILLSERPGVSTRF